MLAFRRRPRLAAASRRDPIPGWGDQAEAQAAWSVGVEEEVMLVVPGAWTLAGRAAEVLDGLPPTLAGSIAPGAHACTLELRTAPHATVTGLTRELAGLRGRLSAALGRHGLRAAVAGMHPAAAAGPPTDGRSRVLPEPLAVLAAREPTFAMHVHVAVPDPEQAVAALGRVRVHLPLLLALSANSPFTRDRESGVASARTALCDELAGLGLPRRFADFEDYATSAGAGPPCFDARLVPELGTLEVRIMDAQTRVDDVAVLAALVQGIVHLEALDGPGERASTKPSVLRDNRRAAVRDGMRAVFTDPVRGDAVAARRVLDDLVAALDRQAGALGHRDQLDRAVLLGERPGETRQRAIAPLRAGEVGGGRRLRRLTARLAAEFGVSSAAGTPRALTG